MEKKEFFGLLECAILTFDDVTNSELLLKYEFSYYEIESSKQILKFIGDLK